MINRKFFFDNVRNTLFNGRFTQNQVNGISAILNEWEERYSRKDDRWLAYMLATTHHETDKTMQPIEEYGKGRQKKYGQRLKMSGQPYSNTDQIFYGRGFVQLTWYENYERAGRKLGVGDAFLRNASLVMQLTNATKIMFTGMIEGWFTGKKLSDYFNNDKEQWPNARKIINGTDRAALIADIAKRYYACISYTTGA